MDTGATDLRGLWVPVVTPFTGDDAVDEDALGLLARRLLADGCAGLVALGTTGEPAALSRHEKGLVVDTCAAACTEAGRPLVVGVGGSATRAAVEAAEWATTRAAPAALLVSVPSYVRPAPAGIVAHFAAVAAATPTPVVVYNVPHRTGCTVDASTVLELAAVPGIVGMKQAVGALDHDTLDILARRPEGFHVLAGDDALIAPTILMGGAGAIAAAGHCCTATTVAMVDAALAGDAATAAAHAQRLLPVVTTGYREPSPAGWKGALHATGQVPTPALRSPLMPASPGAVRAILTAVADAEGTGSAGGASIATEEHLALL